MIIKEVKFFFAEALRSLANDILFKLLAIRHNFYDFKFVLIDETLVLGDIDDHTYLLFFAETSPDHLEDELMRFDKYSFREMVADRIHSAGQVKMIPREIIWGSIRFRIAPEPPVEKDLIEDFVFRSIDEAHYVRRVS